MLGHLSAHQGAAGLLAALGDAGHNLRHVLGAQLANGHVVQEEEGLGANGHHVVHAHGNEVLAHRVVAVEQLGNCQLGAHAVGARDQHRVLHVLEALHGEAASESAEAADDLGTVGGLDCVLDAVDSAGTLVHINAGVGVGHVLGLVSHASSPSLQG